MRWPVQVPWLTLLTVSACGGPAVSWSDPHATGGRATLPTAVAGATSARGGTTARGGAATGGTTSTYVDPGCPDLPPPKIEAECMVFDQSTCPPGEGCYPTITYPSARCEPEIYRMQCWDAGAGQQWDPCDYLSDCAGGFICVVSGLGTQCQRACDTSDPTSCPKGLFCDAIDLQGIGTCY